MPDEWRTDKPPNEQLVEVEFDGRRIRVMAIWGRGGLRPHWRAENGDTLWSVDAFWRWQLIPAASPAPLTEAE